MRQATKLAPDSGEAWWNLSNLKTVHFDAADIAAMRAAIDRHDLGEYDRFHLHFALGKAYEDVGDAAEAFAQYDRANAICSRSSNYHPEAITAEVNASVRLFSRQFFDERMGSGAAARDPIFVLGMPRAGSTLVEQILASHPEVEGTKELPNIPIIAQELGWDSGEYFRGIAALDRDQLRVLGEEYVERSWTQRMTDRPYFVDKMPSNWLQVPLIHLLLPNAKIIDARRHPLACGFSNFKQNYSKGHAFSYDLTTIGHYYREYVRLMTHIDSALPGRVHRIFHERLVDDTEGEIRRMLDYLELPFDSACLRFYETDRAVRTPSAEQVRKPISRNSVDQWRIFDPWLGPLKAALGPVLECYPDAPDFASS
jgi:tetratricopeptide (TPR) repeat protein